MAGFYCLLAVILAIVSTVACQSTVIHGDVPPSETSPSHPTLPGTVANCSKWYTVKSGDSCSTTAQKFGISLDDFFKWNPRVSKDCVSNFWAGYSYCVGVGDVLPPTSPTTTSTSSTTVPTNVPTSVPTSAPPTVPTTVPTSISTTSEQYTAVNPITSYNLTVPPTDTTWPPTKTQPGQPATCNKWHQVEVGDTCDSIQGRYAVWMTYEELLQWNPSLADDCAFPFIGWWVCVGTRPQTSITFDYPTGGSIWIPTPTSYTPPPPDPEVPDFTASPTQPGLVSSCQGFHSATAGDSCSKILEQYFFITEEQLHEWNPALQNDCSGLLANYYYCVAAFPSGSAPMPPTVTIKPTPTQMGTIENCTAWYKTVEDDTCRFIAIMFSTFSEEDFMAWNPSVLENCRGIKEGVWYCVGDANTPSTRTAPIAAPTADPRQPNVIQSCTAWHLVYKDDTCDSIAQSAGIPVENFYAWNPDVNKSGRECNNLLPDYEVCIEAPTVPSSTPVSSRLAMRTVAPARALTGISSARA